MSFILDNADQGFTAPDVITWDIGPSLIGTSPDYSTAYPPDPAGGTSSGGWTDIFRTVSDGINGIANTYGKIQAASYSAQNANAQRQLSQYQTAAGLQIARSTTDGQVAIAGIQAGNQAQLANLQAKTAIAQAQQQLNKITGGNGNLTLLLTAVGVLIAYLQLRGH